MMVYRSIVVGLLAALVLLVAGAQRRTHVLVATPVDVTTASNDAAVVDVSWRAAGADPMPLLGLHPGERVAAVDGVAADSVALAGRWAQAFPGQYLDVEVTGRTSARRILVLVHP
jgi:hypothetical protein